MKKNLFVLLLKLVIIVVVAVLVGYFVFTGCNSCKMFQETTSPKQWADNIEVY